jgi:hypothetical protein
MERASPSKGHLAVDQPVIDASEEERHRLEDEDARFGLRFHSR